MTYDTINDAVTMQGGAKGTLLAGRYRVVRQLGQGGMGSVWLAEDTQLDNKQFAIKMLPSILVSNKRAYRQLKDEALVAMKLTHPNIVTLRAFEENNGNPFLVMDYVEGQTLDEYLAERGALSGVETIKLLKPIAAALDYAHEKGVVHRDVKPGNVMIAKDGIPYILDFGIAREIQETMTRVTGKLSSGTLLYMSPEQLHGASPKSAQDVYSFSAMAYECLKGEPPFSRGQIEYQIDNDMPPPLDKRVSISGTVMQGLAKNPEERPPNCSAVLEGGISRGSMAARGAGVGAGKAVGAVVLLAALAGGWLWWGGNKILLSPTTRPNDNTPTNDVPVPTNNVHVVANDVVTNKVVVGRSDTTNNSPASVILNVGAGETATRPPARPPKKPSKPKPVQEYYAFVSATNQLMELIAKREELRDKSHELVKHSRRGFKPNLDAIDKVWANRFEMRQGISLKDVQDAIRQVSCECADIEKEANRIKGQLESRNRAETKENELKRYLVTKKNNDAELWAHAEKDEKWGDLSRRQSDAAGMIDRGDFCGAEKMFVDVKKEYEKVFAAARKRRDEERRQQADKTKMAKFLADLDAKGFIVDVDANNRPQGSEGRLVLPNGESMVMVWCPPGSFMMGSTANENGRNDSEGFETRHAVRLTKGFWIGRHEVTKSQWKSVMGEGDQGLSPKTEVDYYECETFARRCGARLPTEAEWEYACRAGTQTPYSLGGRSDGKSIDKGKANVDAFWGIEDVGGYRAYANAWGICDMHGNVSEWCRDVYAPYDSSVAIAVDPVVVGDSRSSMSSRVVRGGTCKDKVEGCRSAARNAGRKGRYVGFRLCCDNLP